ncbi:uncharacterized protein LOC143279895 [Babylonia areolata]|uniref:uncharacterized protein LOC143279895 n=1 Tax=Babylonia areolata TaxID=304850 RepID=UPI003FD3F50F
MTSQAETFCRNRRLFDVRRGVVYLRRTDNLAQHQWRHYGTVPAIRTHVIRDIGVTTHLPGVTASQHDAASAADPSLVETTTARESESDATESPRREEESDKSANRTRVLEEFVSHPNISLTEVTDAATGSPAGAGPPPPFADSAVKPQSLEGEQQQHPHHHHHPQSSSADPPPTHSSFSLSLSPSDILSSQAADTPGTDFSGMPPTLPAFRQPLSTSKHDQHSFRTQHDFPEGAPEGAVFDTWGSRDWVVESKLEDDVTTAKSHAPKRYPIMSRVGAGRKAGVGHRPMKTLTDFRSGNGTVRVIHPLPPVARGGPYPEQDDNDDDFDLAALERERTYAVLKRIDRLLEPSRAFFISDLTSSQLEVCPSTPSTSDLTDSLEPHLQGDPPPPPPHTHDRVYVHSDNFQKYFATDAVGDFPAAARAARSDVCEEGDPHQGYYDRIQARLAHFYGHTESSDRPGKDSSSSVPQVTATTARATIRRRGHSEPPPRDRSDDPFGGDSGGGGGGGTLCGGSYPGTSQPFLLDPTCPERSWWCDNGSV